MVPVQTRAEWREKEERQKTQDMGGGSPDNPLAGSSTRHPGVCVPTIRRPKHPTDGKQSHVKLLMLSIYVVGNIHQDLVYLTGRGDKQPSGLHHTLARAETFKWDRLSCSVCGHKSSVECAPIYLGIQICGTSGGRSIPWIFSAVVWTSRFPVNPTVPLAWDLRS